MSQQVENILAQIESLDEADRFVLSERLASLDEGRWQTEAAAARELACQQGVDQPAIDAAVARLRYGS